MTPWPLLLAGAAGLMLGPTLAGFVSLPFALSWRLMYPSFPGSWWPPAVVVGVLVISGGEDRVVLASCGLLLAADLARQQPQIPPESLVAFAMVIGGAVHPGAFAASESIPLLMALGGLGAARVSFPPPIRSIWAGVIVGLAFGLLLAQLWLSFPTLG